jgi:RNA polymerase sigma-70 factor (ECF subfamily)
MRNELDHYRSVEALAVVMARHLTRDGQRRQTMGQLDEAAIVTLSTGPHELLEAKEDAEWLERRISQLPTTQHTLLYMRQVERRSHKELSALLGISEASVSTLLARARRTLLEEIKQRNRQ